MIFFSVQKFIKENILSILVTVTNSDFNEKLKCNKLISEICLHSENYWCALNNIIGQMCNYHKLTNKRINVITHILECTTLWIQLKPKYDSIWFNTFLKQQQICTTLWLKWLNLHDIMVQSAIFACYRISNLNIFFWDCIVIVYIKLNFNSPLFCTWKLLPS